MGVHHYGQACMLRLGTVTLPAAGWTPAVGGELGTWQGARAQMPPLSTSESGFGVQLAEMQHGECPSWVGNPSGGHVPGSKGEQGAN